VHIAMASSYPILDNKQLLTCLNEMDVKLAAEQLMKPTPDVVRKAFDQLVTMLLGVEE
jgi:Nuf2 family